jgi:hypothetical protein
MMMVAKYCKQQMRALTFAKYRKQRMRALAADEVEKEVSSEHDLAEEVGGGGWRVHKWRQLYLHG